MIHQTKGIQKEKKKIQTSYPTTRQQNLQSVLFVNHYFIFLISQKTYSSGHYDMHTLTQQIGNIHQIQSLPTDWLMTTTTNQSSQNLMKRLCTVSNEQNTDYFDKWWKLERERKALQCKVLLFCGEQEAGLVEVCSSSAVRASLAEQM